MGSKTEKLFELLTHPVQNKSKISELVIKDINFNEKKNVSLRGEMAGFLTFNRLIKLNLSIPVFDNQAVDRLPPFQGKTPLMLYLQNSAGRVSENLKVMIDKTTDFTITEDGSGNTILHLFAIYGVECKIDKVIGESDVDALNENEKRPIDNVRNVKVR